MKKYRIHIDDLPNNAAQRITEDQMAKITGGLTVKLKPAYISSYQLSAGSGDPLPTAYGGPDTYGGPDSLTQKVRTR